MEGKSVSTAAGKAVGDELLSGSSGVSVAAGEDAGGCTTSVEVETGEHPTRRNSNASMDNILFTDKPIFVYGLFGSSGDGCANSAFITGCDDFAITF